MSKDEKLMNSDPDGEVCDIEERRSFLIGLGKWSKVIVGGALFGGLMSVEQDAYARGAWINRRGGGGGYRGGGGRWINGRGGYRGGSAARGYGGSWVNRRGGGGWVNRR